MLQGIDFINLLNKEGLTALHLAAKSGLTSVIEVLLSHGADINLKKSNGETCLHLVATLCNDPNSKVEDTPDLTAVRESI